MGKHVRDEMRNALHETIHQTSLMFMTSEIEWVFSRSVGLLISNLVRCNERGFGRSFGVYRQYQCLPTCRTAAIVNMCIEDRVSHQWLEKKDAIKVEACAVNLNRSYVCLRPSKRPTKKARQRLAIDVPAARYTDLLLTTHCTSHKTIVKAAAGVI